jgi:hypothetical protein
VRPPEPVKIKRIGLVLEMEDGSKVMVYADELSHAEVTITTETPAGTGPWGSRITGYPQTSILIEGLEAYRIQHADAGCKVSNAGRELEAMRRAVL